MLTKKKKEGLLIYIQLLLAPPFQNPKYATELHHVLQFSST